MNIPWGAIMIMTNETIKPLISLEENHNFITFSLCAGYSSLCFNKRFCCLCSYDAIR